MARLDTTLPTVEVAVSIVETGASTVTPSVISPMARAISTLACCATASSTRLWTNFLNPAAEAPSVYTPGCKLETA